MAQSVGDNSCVTTAFPCQLRAHVLHSSHVPAERAFVLLGSLREQTEDEEAASLRLFVDCVTVAGPGKFPDIMDIFPSFRGSVSLLTAACVATSLI